MMEAIEKYFKRHSEIIKKINFLEIQKATEIIYTKVKDSKNIFTMGNGGSAHNASHYITDWNKMSYYHQGIKVKAQCLNDNTGLITALANDHSYEDIFTGQLKVLMNDGDLVIVVSGSGNSKNIINALKYANENNADTLAFLGYDGGEAIEIANNSILVPSFDMQICEDVHLSIGHMIMKSLCKIDVINK